jgi:hypothetical protein
MLRIGMNILWPAFLAAVFAEGCFFTVFDPEELLYIAGWHGMRPIAGYTMGFFFFWVFCSLAGFLTYYLNHVPDDEHTG